MLDAGDSHDAPPARASSLIVDLVSGTARVGLGATVLAASEITNRSVRFFRIVLPAGIAQAPLDAIERQVGRRQSEAHKVEQQSRLDVSRAAETVLNQVVVEIVDKLDMEQLIDHVPINRVVARVDLPAVIQEIDLSGIVREGAKGLGGETRDSARGGLMAVDLWSARIVDKILRRKTPRDLALHTDRPADSAATTPALLP